MGLLDGKVAIITGAGNGIGRATALRFAAEGAALIVNDSGGARDGSGGDASVARAVAESIQSQGGRAVANTDSVATEAGAAQMVENAVQHFGGVDILINNAGILKDKTLLNMTAEMFDDVIAVHLRGSFLCLQAAARQMRMQKRGGRIINTTSMSGMLGNFGQANTSAAKAGIYGLTRTASIELQRYDIMVNAVLPLAKTRMTEDLPLFEKLQSSMTPEHIVPGHLFLASALAEGVSGVVLGIAGGKLSLYRLVETRGKFKDEDNGIWKPEEIAEHFEAISKGSG